MDSFGDWAFAPLGLVEIGRFIVDGLHAANASIKFVRTNPVGTKVFMLNSDLGKYNFGDGFPNDTYKAVRQDR